MNAYLYVSLGAVQLIRMSVFNLKINELGFPLDLLLLRSGPYNITSKCQECGKKLRIVLQSFVD